MKKFKNTGNLPAVLMLALCLLLSACNSCQTKGGKQEPAPVETTTGYNYDSIVAADHDFVASQYQAFRFLEADAEFSGILSETENPTVDYIRTVFQYGDTCIIIEHPYKEYDGEPVVTKNYGHWLGCAELTARNAVSLDSCMKIIQPNIKDLDTRYLTFRRIVGPPFPEHGEYIFGHGLLFVDCATGDVRGDGTLSGKLDSQE